MRPPTAGNSWTGRAGVMILTCAGLAACSGRTPTSNASAPAASTVSTLEVTDLLAGTGAEAASGSYVTVHYTGWLHDPHAVDGKGAKFDGSRESGQPFSFVLGARQVIPGWDQGVQGMKVGGQRRLVIPAQLAYGERGAGGVIPPGAALVFDVELLRVATGR